MLYVNQLKPFGKIVSCTWVYGSCNFLNSKAREMSRAKRTLALLWNFNMDILPHLPEKQETTTTNERLVMNLFVYICAMILFCNHAWRLLFVARSYNDMTNFATNEHMAVYVLEGIVKILGYVYRVTCRPVCYSRWAPTCFYHVRFVQSEKQKK